jgi:dienelactone hydrolase
MRSHRVLALTLITAVVVALGVSTAGAYARAASLIIRAAGLGGRAEALADSQAYAVTARPAHSVPTRHGDIPARFYVPDTTPRRTVLVMPGFNSFGIDEPRVASLATDLAGSGFRVMTMSLPDLQQFRLTPAATDTIEDAVAWMTAHPEPVSSDGRVGIIAVSFTGGLSVSAAGRDRIRDKVAFVVSLGGHGDLRRVLRFLATGEAPAVAGVAPPPAPHDYGVAVILNGLADRGVVPSDQVQPLREAIGTFLVGSQLTVRDQAAADRMFAKAREMTARLPEPSRTYMEYVNARAVQPLGSVLVPFLDQTGADDPALSPELAPPPAAPVYLLHGHDDNIIPAAESVLLAGSLEDRGGDVEVLLSGLITHAQISTSATASDAWKLIRFWTGILQE